MAINKVEINGEVKLDLTQDTVSEDTLLQGTTAHDAAGNPIEGKVVTTPVPKTSNLLKGDGAGGVSAAVPGMDYLAEAPVTSVNGKTGDVIVEGTQILVDGILEGDGAGNISAAETVQTEMLDVEVLPTVTTADNGKILKVTNGEWVAQQPTTEAWTFTLEDGSTITKNVCIE